MTDQWASWAAASIIAALYVGVTQVPVDIDMLWPELPQTDALRRPRSTCSHEGMLGGVQLQGRGRLLHIQAAQYPLRIARHDSGDGCQWLGKQLVVKKQAGIANWSAVITYDTFSEDPRCAPIPAYS